MSAYALFQFVNALSVPANLTVQLVQFCFDFVGLG
jgi:hypothetical protein